jgi:putative signal transducing protein
MLQADFTYRLTFEAIPAGTLMRWAGQVRPKGAFRLLGPLITRIGVRREKRTWAALKRHLEAQPVQNKGTGIMGGAPVPVAVVASRVEADVIVGMLRSHGLRAVVSADDVGGQEPQLQLRGVRVLVAASDEASARRLLADARGTSL